MRRSASLQFEQLEGRILRANVGLPWRDPMHLTLSFAPDGTAIAGDSSVLFQDLDSTFSSPTAWQNVIAQAFQTWAAQTNISIGVVSDDGAPYGTAGLMQGDPRFGDIRIGARPMSPEVMAVTVPPDPYISGTLSGDMILNSAADLTPTDLYDVVLHEAGLALGLVETTDPTSVMYPVINPDAALSPADVQNIQSLYGVRAPDPNANTIATATPMSQPALYLGTTPLVAYGNLAAPGTADFYSFSSPLAYGGPVTIQLETSGISLMQPEVQVFNSNFKSIGEAQSSSELGDILTIHLPTITPFQHYYVEVGSPSSNEFGTGRYALAVTFNGLSLVNPSSLPSILQGPYDSLSAGDLAGLLGDTKNLLFQTGLAVNSTPLTADPLSSVAGYPVNSQYSAVASLDYPGASEFYLVRAPQNASGQPSVLTVSLAQMPINGTLPVASVFDAYGNPVKASILLNGNGNDVVQAIGVTPGAAYYIRVSANAAPAPATGNYSLVASFGTAPAVINTFASGILSASNTSDQYTLYVAQTQLFELVLSTTAASSNAQVDIQITDSNGRVVYSSSDSSGGTTSGAGVMLTPGAYQVTISLAASSGGPVPVVAYSLTGQDISDPIGPARSDPSEEPMYPCPGNPAVNCYCYPNGTYSTVPYQYAAK